MIETLLGRDLLAGCRKMLLDGIVTVKRVFGQNMLNNTGVILLLNIIKSTDEEAEYDQVSIDVS